MNTPTLEKFPTWLPCFPGFYNTLFEPQFEQELEYYKEQELLPDTADEGDLLHGWDNSSYERAVVQCICDCMPGYFPKESGVIGCKLEKVVRPKEYNFTNDSANVTFELDMSLFAPWLREYLKKNEKDWADYIYETYRHRDGFCSYYSCRVEDWNEAIENMLNGVEEKNERGVFSRTDIGTAHLLGRVLEFVLNNEGEHTLERMYYDVGDHVYIGEYVDLEKVKERLKEKGEM